MSCVWRYNFKEVNSIDKLLKVGSLVSITEMDWLTGYKLYGEDIHEVDCTKIRRDMVDRNFGRFCFFDEISYTDETLVVYLGCGGGRSSQRIPAEHCYMKCIHLVYGVVLLVFQDGPPNIRQVASTEVSLTHDSP